MTIKRKPKSKIFQLLYKTLERNNLSLMRRTDEKYNRLLFDNSIIHNNIVFSVPRSYKIDIDKYTNFNHPYQKLIREVLENFMQSKIQNNFYIIILTLTRKYNEHVDTVLLNYNPIYVL